MNFDKKKFSEILVKVKESYGSINQMAEKTGVTSAYLSKLIRLMYDNAPSPEILKKIADCSNNVTTYQELMQICGYIDKEYLRKFIIDNYNIPNVTFEKAIGTNIFDGLNKKEIEALAKIIEDQHERRKSGSFDKSKYFENLDSDSKSKIVDRYNGMLKAQMDIFLSVKKTTKTLQEIDNSESIFEKSKILNDYSGSKFYMCPVYGKISAGIPNWAEEGLEGYLPIDPNLMDIVNPEECFFLKVNRRVNE